LTRRQEQSSYLSSHEIIPVIGDIGKPETYEHILPKVTAVIDATSDPQNPPNVGALLAATKKHSTKSKKTFIFTSGLLVVGDTNNEVIDEWTTAKPPFPFVVEREKIEQEVINSREVHGIVLRLGIVYGFVGGNGGHFVGGSAFDLSKTDGKIVIHGKPEKQWSWVHVGDLGRLYVLAIQKSSLASGELFNVGSFNHVTYEAFRKKAAHVAGYKNAEVVIKPVSEGSVTEKLLDVSVRVSYKKAQSLLGWVPNHTDVLEDLDILYGAWKASEKK